MEKPVGLKSELIRSLYSPDGNTVFMFSKLKRNQKGHPFDGLPAIQTAVIEKPGS